MALIKAENLAAQLRGLASMPLVHQLGLLVGLAASVAVGVAVVLWSQDPVYSPLYGDLSDADSSEVIAALQAQGVEYRVNERTGTVLVPASRLHETRIALASAGLPKSGSMGFELLDQKSAFGDSEFMETARYQRALEGELARTIGSLADVRGVRVHLALPKRSLFVREREKPSASVLVNLAPGRTLEPAQVQAVVNLVSSSVPNLERGRVTVIDQSGRLLTPQDSDNPLGLTTTQFEYARRIENSYAKRIEEILTPILGPGRVRAQVVADLDFTVVESTEEAYDPNPKALRSEQVSEERSEGSALAGGIPGSLSNQPPAGGAINSAGLSGDSGAPPVSTSRNSVRNFELDRTVKHVRSPVGVLKRLSVAVVVDDVVGVDENGQPKTKPLSADERKDLTALVEKAVGFDKDRGDSIQLVNASFQPVGDTELFTRPSFWEQPWLWDALKQGGGILLLALLVLGVLRPVMRGLAEKGARATVSQPRLKGTLVGGALPASDELPADRLTVSSDSGQPLGQLAAPQDYSSQLSRAQSMVNEDPKLAANLVKEWLTQ
jgi:flagellar M-ring protein FliF